MIVMIGISCVHAAAAEESRDAKLKRVYEMYAQYKAETFPEVAEISVQEAMRLAAQDRVQFIDARTPAEMTVSTLPGAISHRQFLENRQSVATKEPVVYCTISYRSGVLAGEMKADGVRVRNLKGGLLAWILEGGQVYKGNQTTSRVHVYGSKWDLAPQGYQTEMFSYWQRLVAGRSL